MEASLRLQVFLSRRGVCSRRKAMDLIRQGGVRVNGRVIREPSHPVRAGQDQVTVQGAPVQDKSHAYILLNKPCGYVTTRLGQFSQRTVIDLLPREFNHLHPAGRLDKDSEGLILLTNDGDVTYRLTHPRFSVEKIYQVKISGQLSAVSRQRLEKGVILEGQRTAPAVVKDIKRRAGTTEFLIILHEGRKRQIRLMLDQVGHQVTFLKRISQGPLILGRLKSGDWRSLTHEEVSLLKQELKITHD